MKDDLGQYLGAAVYLDTDGVPVVPGVAEVAGVQESPHPAVLVHHAVVTVVSILGNSFQREE